MSFVFWEKPGSPGRWPSRVMLLILLLAGIIAACGKGPPDKAVIQLAEDYEDEQEKERHFCKKQWTGIQVVDRSKIGNHHSATVEFRFKHITACRGATGNEYSEEHRYRFVKKGSKWVVATKLY